MGKWRYEEPPIPISGIHAASLPVSDLDAAIAFYEEVLDLSLAARGEGWAAMACGGQRLMLREKGSPGGDSGVYLSVPSIYDVHRQLVDRDANILQPPLRGEDGLLLLLEDDDRNVIRIVESP